MFSSGAARLIFGRALAKSKPIVAKPRDILSIAARSLTIA